jgi:hypothetical protein
MIKNGFENSLRRAREEVYAGFEGDYDEFERRVTKGSKVTIKFLEEGFEKRVTKG